MSQISTWMTVLGGVVHCHTLSGFFRSVKDTEKGYSAFPRGFRRHFVLDYSPVPGRINLFHGNVSWYRNSERIYLIE